MPTRRLLLALLGLLPLYGRAQPAAGAPAAAAGDFLPLVPVRQAHDTENQVVRRGIARRKAHEADRAFLKRVFPASFSAETLLAYSWRPGAYGKQLFFSRRQLDQHQQEGEGIELFVLDPHQPNTYAVQKLWLEPIGDITNLAALVFADVDRDGQKELLALVYAEVQEAGLVEHGDGTKELAYARLSHQCTYVFRYAGPNKAGQPQYRADATPRPYLNGLPTAAAVRRALARHQAQHPVRR